MGVYIRSMASHTYKDLKIYKGNSTNSSQIVGTVKDGKIHKGNSTNSSQIVGSVANIKREIKDSNSADGATIVAAYNFLIRSIF